MPAWHVLPRLLSVQAAHCAAMSRHVQLGVCQVQCGLLWRRAARQLLLHAGCHVLHAGCMCSAGCVLGRGILTPLACQPAPWNPSPHCISTATYSEASGPAASAPAPLLLPTPRFPPSRPQKYDRNKFLQANFRFLVADTVDVAQFSSDADKMFDWDDVVQVGGMVVPALPAHGGACTAGSCQAVTVLAHSGAARWWR
jgi:hypothetical protein